MESKQPKPHSLQKDPTVDKILSMNFVQFQNNENEQVDQNDINKILFEWLKTFQIKTAEPGQKEDLNKIIGMIEVKEQVQSDMIKYYFQYLDQVKEVINVAQDIVKSNTTQKDVKNQIISDLKSNDSQVRKMLNKIERYQEEYKRLWIKRNILAVLSDAIAIDESILFEKDTTELTSDDYTRDFEEKFLNALKKLDKIKELSKSLTVDEDEESEEMLLPNNLSNSLKERVKYIEDNAYNKLIKFLKLKMKDFESPLDGGSKFITFIKITLELIQQKSDYYNFVVKELVESRRRYISKSFSDKKYQVIGSLPSDKLSTLLSWLHQSLINEIDILKSTHLDVERIKIWTNSIFNTGFAKSFKKEIENFDFNKIELRELFEIFYILENYVSFIYEKTLPRIFDSEDEEYVNQQILNFEFIKPLIQFREVVLKEFIEKSEDRVLEFKQCLIDDRVFEIPKVFKELKYIFNGLIGVVVSAGNSQGVSKYLREIIRNFIVKIILSTDRENAEGFIETIGAKTIWLIRDFYIAQRKVVENKDLLADETEMITDRIEFLEYWLKMSTEKEIWYKLGLEEDGQENITEYVNLLKLSYEKMRWIPLKLNTLLHLDDFNSKQLIAEESKNNVMIRMNEILQELLEYCEDELSLQTNEALGIELIESIRKKIVY